VFLRKTKNNTINFISFVATFQKNLKITKFFDPYRGTGT
jgi:hypothetical protein